jgi:hypothetical protein
MNDFEAVGRISYPPYLLETVAGISPKVDLRETCPKK